MRSPPGRLGQRGRRRRAHRAGRRVGQALQRQRAALAGTAPGMVGERAAREPVLPVMGRPDHLAVGVVVVVGGGVLAPRQRDERGVALAQQCARTWPGRPRTRGAGRCVSGARPGHALGAGDGPGGSRGRRSPSCTGLRP